MKTLLLSALVITPMYLLVRYWKRKAAKKAKVVKMEMEDYDYETYHKN